MNIKNIKPQKGSILISEPFLPDDNFKRSVILLCDHNEEGSFGLVINKNLELTVHDALEEFPEFEGNIYMGGPVESNTLHYLHTLGDVLDESIEIMNGLFWGGNFETLKILIEQKSISSDEIRFFLGYSGWGVGQLDDELKEKSWIVTNGRPDYIFNDHGEELWREILKEMGGQYFIMSNFPESPLLN